MVQVKKKKLEAAILDAARELFRVKGYLGTRMSEIAATAGTSVSNLYIYFPSKLHLLYEVYTPMVTSRMMRLANESQSIKDPEKRLRLIFLTLWRDLPREDNAFARNLMQAIITAPEGLEKPHHPLSWLEEFTNDLIKTCLPESRHFLVEDRTIAFLAWMAFDGFVANVNKEEDRDIEKLVVQFTDMLLGQTPPLPA
ncbi:MAG: TetR/AcrR family transcriptional regulator [Xanthomonadales bacterium]|nr:TetR/AcrR family transcriptional regulator [Xanthomonadales bacterium]